MKHKQASFSALFSLIILLSLSQSAEGQVTGTISVTPSLSQTLSGTVVFTVTVNPAYTFSAIYINVDGAAMFDGLSNHAGPFYTPENPSKYSFDTTKYLNGSHQFSIAATNTQGGPDFGDYAITINIRNGSGVSEIPFQIRAGYNELWLTPGQTATLNPLFINTDNTRRITKNI